MAECTRRIGPIGVFDSGLGGLTVVKALTETLPAEDIVYFGDTARVPYGTKSRETIIRFSQENTRLLLKHKVKMVVVACNSSASHALTILKKTFDLPIIGVIEPGARKAVGLTKNGRIGIIATPATIRSEAYTRQIHRLNPRIKVYTQACPLFVPLVEEGWQDAPVTRAVAASYLAGMKTSGVDTLILGCTHYPLLKPVLQKVMGRGVTLVDSAREVAGEVEALLAAAGPSRRTRKARCRFLVSDEPQHFRMAARRFLAHDLRDVRRCSV